MISGVVHANTSVISYDEWLRRISASCMTLVEHIEQLWILFANIFFSLRFHHSYASFRHIQSLVSVRMYSLVL